MATKWVVFPFVFIVLFSGFSSVFATPPAKIVTSVASNVVSALVKWLWSMKSTTKTSVPSGRSMIKFEGGYTVETVFDGIKLGIEPYSVEVSPNGELFVLDSENSNIYKISMPFSRYSRPKLIAGSTEGYTGHVDGKLREARMNHPKGLSMDDRGNVYIADTLNMAIRKISDTGVTTIAGGKSSRGGGHVDGPSEDSKFSDDFDVVYVGSSCSLLVIDRGNQAIREIQLNEDDCSSHQYDDNFHLGMAVLAAAGFFGYMLALLQQRVRAMFSSHDDSRTAMKEGTKVAPYQGPPKSVRPQLIPSEDEPEKPEEGFFGSVGRVVLNTGSSVAAVFGGLFSGFRKKPHYYHLQHQCQQPDVHSNGWPTQMQESFVIPDEDDPPPMETRATTPKKSHLFMTKDLKKKHQNQSYYNRWDVGYQQQQQLQTKMQQQQQPQQQHHHRHYSSNPQTYYENSCETNEIVFGAVQEQDGRREAVVIKAVDYADPRYNHHNIRPRMNYMGYSHGY
ncbi:hypothetical protein SLE2022_193100 [Rubroshorea leprosula]